MGERGSEMNRDSEESKMSKMKKKIASGDKRVCCVFALYAHLASAICCIMVVEKPYTCFSIHSFGSSFLSCFHTAQ